ncbi:MAG: 3-dehydroquinate synthase [Mongoliibacter sp.]|uniref:3-dehydroquinate synthase n=1 Tax=Mongoliibacter sp. TaxID=2022438 RepID=UPI0012F1D229|nr:3-dehydroquinate synthase [Mongoliibacter sp.]TVP51164.1 MAG: 3-dehydroquinate synthase [Mongoliibacter sp.]
METIIFSQQIAQDLGTYIKQLNFSKLGVITDSNTEIDCYPLLKESLPIHLHYSFQAGEANKNLHTCMGIWQWMTDGGMDRKALIINLGGGVTGDMGGFCAATYKRGIRFVNVPTTLLSQVDASVGGKLGVDFNGYKNHIGVFTQPNAVIISGEFLKTLPERELRSGYAEVIKHGLIKSEPYFKCLKVEEWKDQNWRDIIEKSVSIKKEVVEKDPKEAGLRKILNFGHTIGHAFESFYLDTEKHLLHGEAIAIGMLCEAYLSHKKSGLSVSDLKTIQEMILQVFGKFDFSDGDVAAIVSLCGQDKKNEGEVINFSLLNQIGQCDYNIPASLEEITEAIQLYRSL